MGSPFSLSGTLEEDVPAFEFQKKKAHFFVSGRERERDSGKTFSNPLPFSRNDLQFVQTGRGKKVQGNGNNNMDGSSKGFSKTVFGFSIVS
jgi:hypothetical protein